MPLPSPYGTHSNDPTPPPLPHTYDAHRTDHISHARWWPSNIHKQRYDFLFNLLFQRSRTKFSRKIRNGDRDAARALRVERHPGVPSNPDGGLSLRQG